MSQTTPLCRVVQQLDRLLQEENEALRRLDHRTLDSLTDQKVQLLSELAQVSRDGADRSTLRDIARLRELALGNQMLMVHARDLTQGVFDVMTGNETGKRAGQGRLLEVRG